MLSLMKSRVRMFPSQARPFSEITTSAHKKQHIHAVIHPSFFENEFYMLDDLRVVRSPFYDLAVNHKVSDYDAEKILLATVKEK